MACFFMNAHKCFNRRKIKWWKARIPCKSYWCSKEGAPYSILMMGKVLCWCVCVWESGAKTKISINTLNVWQLWFPRKCKRHFLEWKKNKRKYMTYRTCNVHSSFRHLWRLCVQRWMFLKSWEKRGALPSTWGDLTLLFHQSFFGTICTVNESVP